LLSLTREKFCFAISEKWIAERGSNQSLQREPVAPLLRHPGRKKGSKRVKTSWKFDPPHIRPQPLQYRIDFHTPQGLKIEQKGR